MGEELSCGAFPYTKEDFLTLGPYEALYQFHKEPFTHAAKMQELADYADKQVGFKGFKTMYKRYIESLKIQRDTVYIDNVTTFSKQPLELNAGDWEAGDDGIYKKNGFNSEVACPHPIMPVERLVNIDTGEEKLKLSFRKGGNWREIIVSKTVLANANKVTELAGCGIAVTSQNAKAFVQYISDLENLNYDLIPETKCVGRLGWIDGYGFSPYVEGLVFDGAEEFRDRFDSVCSHGSYDAWKDACRSIRGTEGTVTRIVLAAGFASVLVKPCSCLPFFLHLWGGSEAGKSVGLMMAASIWANPEIGRFIQTFNATGVGKELGATFLNSMPLMLDELQMVENSRSKFQQMIYELAEGVGRTRGKKSGGIQKTGIWRNCIMTNGENPLVDSNTAAGAVNRTVEIFCRDTKLFTRNRIGDAKAVARFFQRNYGFAGENFVAILQKPGNLEKAVALQDEFAAQLSAKGDVTDKQSASAALILTADALAEEWIFQDGICLKVDDLVPFLTTKTRMDQNLRALEFLYDQVSVNLSHFSPERAADRSAEIWGDADRDFIYIIKSQFDKLLNENGFNAESFLGWARQNGTIRLGKDGKSTINHRILGKPVRCVWLCAPPDHDCPEEGGVDELPL